MTKKRSASVPYVQPYRYASPNVPLAVIRRFARQIAERFHPDKIILFGSYAYGRPHNESDIDLMVIMPTHDVIASGDPYQRSVRTAVFALHHRPHAQANRARPAGRRLRLVSPRRDGEGESLV